MSALHASYIKAFATVTAVGALAACAGGSSQQPIVMPPAPNTAPMLLSQSTVVPLRLYVANSNADSLTIYRETDSGNVPPQTSVRGSHTQLHSPAGIAVDAAGRIGVADSIGLVKATVYARGASGDAAPVRVLSCGGMTVTLGAAFDREGDLYVTSGDDGDNIAVLGPSVAGCVQNNRILAGLNTAMHQPFAVVVAPAGTIYVANGSGASVETFAPGATGNVKPLTALFGSRTGIGTPAGVALDASGTTYVTDYRSNSVLIFAANANGNVAPLRTIAGPNTGIDAPIGIAVSPSTGAIFVANSRSSTITVYAANASGNASPIRRIEGAKTGLVVPYQITLAP